MKFKPQFKIKLSPNLKGRPDVEEGSSYGTIAIGDFYEHFYMSPSCWSINKYLKQWSMAFDRLSLGEDDKINFIVNVQQETPMVEMWAIYIEGDMAYFQNYLIIGDQYKELVGDKSFTPETSFDFIPPREIVTEEGDKISEWSVKIIEG